MYEGAPIWRIGADISTRFTTEVPLIFGGATLPAGQYSMFADLKPGAWTLVFSNYGAKQTPDDSTPNTLWGAFGYKDNMDQLRVPMFVDSNADTSFDQLVIGFIEMTAQGGILVILWEKTVAAVPFAVAR